jgi:hypothetical protein
VADPFDTAASLFAAPRWDDRRVGVRWYCPVIALYQVRYDRGPAWHHGQPRRAQDGWVEHAIFMDALAERGTVLLGGPLGDDDTGDALLVVSGANEDAVRSALATDPWNGTVLTIKSVQRWSLWLRSPALATALPNDA